MSHRLFRCSAAALLDGDFDIGLSTSDAQAVQQSKAGRRVRMKACEIMQVIDQQATLSYQHRQTWEVKDLEPLGTRRHWHFLEILFGR